ncbi:MAG: histidine--tRNA ligase [Opitutales bacterium]|nr:histidine--tRNA ligase [Opitutales bacterium]MBT6380156.1 histidine--tRNA ligase [Opitutales bacterium]MBT6768262.1 histidine--tRNA ligase [Opitutales bacterium]
MSNFKSLPGFREFYPEAFAERRFLFQVWRQVARRFGFQEFDGPVLESLELFKAKSGDEIESQLFCFEDKGGREISLRPELTPTLARMVAAKGNALKRPIKWFSIGDNFRYERMQKGRLRCFTQLNADILGEAGPAAELELISLLIQLIQGFGLGKEDFFIRLSDRNLWMLYLEAQGFESETSKILEIVDKWERMPDEVACEKLSAIAGDRGEALQASIGGFLKVSNLAELSNAFKTVSGGADMGEALQARIDDWSTLLDGFDAMGLSGFVEMDLSIVRGLAYYTGFVFEAFDRAKSNRAIAGGGRYNNLIKKMGGPDMPAVGFGMGDVVLADVLKERGIMPKFVDTIDAYMVIGGEAERAVALADANALRQSGFSVDYPLKTSGFGKQFKMASASGARVALIYGSEELEKGVVKLRDMTDRSEEEVPRERLILALRDRLR